MSKARGKPSEMPTAEQFNQAAESITNRELNQVYREPYWAEHDSFSVGPGQDEAKTDQLPQDNPQYSSLKVPKQKR